MNTITDNKDLTVKQLFENGYNPAENHLAVNALAMHYIAKGNVVDKDNMFSKIVQHVQSTGDFEPFNTMLKIISETIPVPMLGNLSYNDLCEYEELFELLGVEMVRLYMVFDTLYADYKSAAYVADMYGKASTEIELKKHTWTELKNMNVHIVLNDIQIPIDITQGVRMETGENVF